MICDTCQQKPTCTKLCYQFLAEYDLPDIYSDDCPDYDYPTEYYDYSTDDANNYEYQQDLVNDTYAD